MSVKLQIKIEESESVEIWQYKYSNRVNCMSKQELPVLVKNILLLGITNGTLCWIESNPALIFKTPLGFWCADTKQKVPYDVDKYDFLHKFYKTIQCFNKLTCTSLLIKKPKSICRPPWLVCTFLGKLCSTLWGNRDITLIQQPFCFHSVH